MRDRSSLRARMRTVLTASAGATVLVVGGLSGCSISETSGNLMPSDVGEEPADTVIDSIADQVSGNLLPPDVTEDIDVPADVTPDTAADQ